MRALIGRYPFIVHVRSTIAFGVFDKLPYEWQFVISVSIALVDIFLLCLVPSIARVWRGSATAAALHWRKSDTSIIAAPFGSFDRWSICPPSATPSSQDSKQLMRAAQYVRMSTDYQRYSIENQAATICFLRGAAQFDDCSHILPTRGVAGLRITVLALPSIASLLSNAWLSPSLGTVAAANHASEPETATAIKPAQAKRAAARGIKRAQVQKGSITVP